MGMCRWMGSHFHDWIDYNGVTFLDCKTFKQATGTMIPLVYVGSISDLIGFTYKMNKVKAEVDTTFYVVSTSAFILYIFRRVTRMGSHIFGISVIRK